MTLRDLVGDQLAQTGLGLAIGTMARYAMRIQDRLPIGPREIIADILLLGMNAMLTLVVIERLGATGNGAVLTAALFGIAQDRVIRVLRRRMEKRAAAIEAALFGEEPEPEAPAGLVLRPLALDQGLGRTLRTAFREPTETPAPEDQIELLRKLERKDIS